MMKTIHPLSGFPEWLPAEQRLLDSIVQTLKHTFGLYDFVPVETRFVETLELLEAKSGGEILQEIYTLQRLRDKSTESSQVLALHYDLTLPLARYVVENRHKLVFPFKRYQIQKVWRGERPQAGRFREFIQVDVDILAEERLDFFFDIEALEVLVCALLRTPFPAMTLHISHRVLFGQLLQHIGISQLQEVMAIVDKIRKVDKAQTTQSFAELGLSAEHIRVLWQLCESTFPSVHALFQALQTWNCLNVEIEKTLTNLSALESALTERCLGATFCFDLSIVRGLDYYTGLVVEGFLQEAPHLGAVLSGGRYDNLTQSLGRGKPLPGVGFSLGLTRIFSYALAQNLFSLQQQSTAQMAIANLGPHYEGSPWQVARVFRKRGIACALLHEAGKLGKQMMYCEKRGIPYLVFPEDNSYNRLIVRNLIEKTQAPCDVHVFNPCS